MKQSSYKKIFLLIKRIPKILVAVLLCYIYFDYLCFDRLCLCILILQCDRYMIISILINVTFIIALPCCLPQLPHTDGCCAYHLLQNWYAWPFERLSFTVFLQLIIYSQIHFFTYPRFNSNGTHFPFHFFVWQNVSWADFSMSSQYSDSLTHTLIFPTDR